MCSTALVTRIKEAQTEQVAVKDSFSLEARAPYSGTPVQQCGVTLPRKQRACLLAIWSWARLPSWKIILSAKGPTTRWLHQQ